MTTKEPLHGTTIQGAANSVKLKLCNVYRDVTHIYSTYSAPYTKCISGTRYLLTSADSHIAQIATDSDADGSYETPIIPTSNLTGTLTQDSVPPTITFEYLANSNQIFIDAIDNESSVDGVAYSTDQNNFQRYTSPISVSPILTTTVWPMAQDKRGIGQVSPSMWFRHSQHPHQPRHHSQFHQPQPASPHPNPMLQATACTYHSSIGRCIFDRPSCRAYHR